MGLTRNEAIERASKIWTDREGKALPITTLEEVTRNGEPTGRWNLILDGASHWCGLDENGHTDCHDECADREERAFGQPPVEEVLPSTQADPQRWLNAYSVSRHYGGPEEGGWYYDVGSLIVSIPIPRGTSDEMIEKLKAVVTEVFGWPKEPRQGRFSVIGGDDFECWIEDAPGDNWPKERPHYE